MNMRLILGSGIVAGALLLFFSCSKSSGSDDGNTSGFDKTAMLTYYADSIVIPGYQEMQKQVNTLQIAVNAFADAPSVSTQTAAKEAYRLALLQYERMSVYNFGPAGVALLEVYTNFFGGFDNSFSQQGELTGYSVDSATIESNITSGNYDFTVYTRNSFYSQGFPALGYLLVGPNAINKFSSNTANRKKYTKDVIARVKTLVDKVSSDWGGFRSSFISNTKTDVGSSIGNLVNQFAYQMDALKGPKIGWPFGKQSNGIVFATKTESYFAGFSVELAKANVAGLKNAYTGGAGNKGIGSYLIALKQESLHNDVLAQFNLVIDKLNAVPDPLSTSLTANAPNVEAAYKEIQKLLTLLKTDVASATGVQITFMDNDGD